MSNTSNTPPEKDKFIDRNTERRAVGGGKSMATYLQPANVEDTVRGYPEKIRAAVIQLARYCRERCRCDHKVMAQHTKQAKFSRSYQYFYGLFRGTAEMDGANAQEDLIELAARLRAYEAMAPGEQDSFYYRGTCYEEFEGLTISRTKPHVRNRLVMVSGPTGSGKTEMWNELRRAHGKDLSMATVDSTHTTSFYEWLSILCVAVGVSPGVRAETKAEQVLINANALDVIFLDDAHRLFREAAGTNQPCWNFIQRLHDRTSAVIIPSITDVFAKEILGIPYFDQFFGRAGGRQNLIEMPQFPEAEEVIGIAGKYGLRQARQHRAGLLAAAHGWERLRPLQDALANARAEAEGPFDFALLEKFLPSAAETARVERANPAKKAGGRR